MGESALRARLARSGRWLVARRELATLRREKTIVLALLIQLFIAAFSSFLLVGMISLYDPGAVGSTGIAIGVVGNASGTVTGAIEDEGPWHLVEFDQGGSAESAFATGRVDALLIADEEASGRITIEALVPDEHVRSTVVVIELRSALDALERERRVVLAERLEEPPMPVPDVPPSAPTFAFTYTVLLPLLVFLPVFISGSVAADAITEETDAGTFELLRVSPLSAVEVVEGKMLAMTALAPAQAAAWLALLSLNGTHIDRPVAILVLVTAIATVVVALGSGLALRLRDRQSAQLVYSIAIIVLFVAASALPEAPVNAVARLAVGSHGSATLVMVAGYVLVAVVALVVVRRSVASGRLSPGL